MRLSPEDTQIADSTSNQIKVSKAGRIRDMTLNMVSDLLEEDLPQLENHFWVLKRLQYIFWLEKDSQAIWVINPTSQYPISISKRTCDWCKFFLFPILIKNSEGGAAEESFFILARSSSPTFCSFAEVKFCPRYVYLLRSYRTTRLVVLFTAPRRF